MQGDGATPGQKFSGSWGHPRGEVTPATPLKRSLAIYRVVFGQPRPEERLGLLEKSDVDREEIEQWMVSLKSE